MEKNLLPIEELPLSVTKAVSSKDRKNAGKRLNTLVNGPTFGTNSLCRGFLKNKNPKKTAKSAPSNPKASARNKTVKGSKGEQANSAAVAVPLQKESLSLAMPGDVLEAMDLEPQEKADMILQDLIGKYSNQLASEEAPLYSDAHCDGQKGQHKQSWTDRVQGISAAWLNAQPMVANAVLKAKGYRTPTCTSCRSNLPLSTTCIICTTCKSCLCPSCDFKEHATRPFDHRFITKSTTGRFLLPTEFVTDKEEIYTQEIPVPCFYPPSCSNPECQTPGMIERICGSQSVIVVNNDGRFDLKSAAFHCLGCGMEREATSEEYIISGYWPGSPSGGEYLFTEDVLSHWNDLKHETPSTSEGKFVQTLEHASRRHNRRAVINPNMFHQAARHFDFHQHLCDITVRKMKKNECRACYKEYLAAHADGIFKLYRWLAARDGGLTPLYDDDAILVADKIIQQHIDLINSVYPKNDKHENCGAAQYRAARSDSSKFKGQDETGLITMCCRHGVIMKAANLYKGETYRHTHFLHNYAFHHKVRFFINDVVCRYWAFAEKVGWKLPEYRALTEAMIAFLSRMHGKTHTLDCQIEWSGHWMKGAAGTIGEEMEQVFSKLARYCSVTRHMGKEARREHIIGGMHFWNNTKERNMAKFLAKRMIDARRKRQIYYEEFVECLEKMGYVEEDLPTICDDLKRESKSHAKRSKSTIRTPITALQDELEHLHLTIHNLRKKIEQEADGSKARTRFRRKITVTKTRAFQVMGLLNARRPVDHEQDPCNKTGSPEEADDDALDASRKTVTSEEMAREDPLLDRFPWIQFPSDANEDPCTSNGMEFDHSEKPSQEIVTEHHFSTGIFPWQSASDRTFKERYELIEKWMLSLRYDEEIEQTEKEMGNFLSSLWESRKLLMEDIAKYEEDVSSEINLDLSLSIGKAIVANTELRRITDMLREAIELFQGKIAVDLEELDDAFEDEADDEEMDLLWDKIHSYLVPIGNEEDLLETSSTQDDNQWHGNSNKKN